MIASRVNWKYLLPKLIFAIPVVVTLFLVANDIISSSKPDAPTSELDPSLLVYFIIVLWVTSEGVELLINRFVDPIEMSVNQSFNKILPDLNHVAVHSDDEAFDVLIRAFERDAQKSVETVMWHFSDIQTSDSRMDAYFRALKKSMNRVKTQRRIAWRPEHLGSLELYEQYNNVEGLEIRFVHPDKLQEKIPIVPCFIVDRRVVMIGWGYLGNPRLEKTSVTIAQPEAVSTFVNHFTYLWQVGEIIKERGKHINQDRVNELKRELLNS